MGTLRDIWDSLSATTFYEVTPDYHVADVLSRLRKPSKVDSRGPCIEYAHNHFDMEAGQDRTILGLPLTCSRFRFCSCHFLTWQFGKELLSPLPTSKKTPQFGVVAVAVAVFAVQQALIVDIYSAPKSPISEELSTIKTLIDPAPPTFELTNLAHLKQIEF